MQILHFFVSRMSKSWHISKSSFIVTLVVDQEGIILPGCGQCFDMVGRDEVA